jgi:enoyl-CoA hydratase/carnithine racemase
MRSVPELIRTGVEGRVARLELNRPEAMNAITVGLARELEASVRAAPAYADVILLSGAGGNFSAGGDYRQLERLRAADATRELFDSFGRACTAIGEVPVPVVAVVRGCAMAGGFELMLACDFAIVAADARLCDNHVNFAMVPGGGGSQRLARLVGRQRALAHMLTGEEISGERAAAMGLAWRAVPDEELDGAAAEIAEQIASKDRAALAEIKRLVRVGLELPLAEGLQRERDAVVAHLRRDGALDAFTR